jgi:hypothetical protein
VVALKGDERRAADDALDLKLRRERVRRQPEQVLLAGELGDRGPAPLASIGNGARPLVQVGLRLPER